MDRLLADEQNTVEVVERYRDYSPPLNAAPIVGRILDYVPPQALTGLGSVVLTDVGALPRRWWRQSTSGSKSSIVLGLYHEATASKPAWIEVFVDNIFAVWPKLAMKIPLFRELAFAFTVNHEVGHHIQISFYKGHHEDESIAEAWSRRLSKTFVQRRFWFLWPILKVGGLVLRTAKAIPRLLKGV